MKSTQSGSQLVLLCDVDGVVADLHKTWLMQYNEKYNDVLTLDQVTQWEISKFVKPECGSNIFDFIKHPNFYAWVDPIPDAIETILKLRDLGIRVVFITSCLDGTMDQKVAWLRRYGLIASKYNSGKDFIATSDKSLVVGDVALDDHTRNLDIMLPKYKLLYDQPYNRSSTKYSRVLWSDVYNYMKGL